jgi:hypothetical protein
MQEAKHIDFEKKKLKKVVGLLSIPMRTPSSLHIQKPHKENISYNY